MSKMRTSPSLSVVMVVPVLLAVVASLACSGATSPAPGSSGSNTVAASTVPSSIAGSPSKPAGSAPAGWTDSILFADANAWEPVIATDPSAPWVYAVSTVKYLDHCKDCPTWAMSFRASSDGGKTWGDMTQVCKCKGYNWIGDPGLRTDAAGNLYASFLATPGYRIMFSKSTDHGATWTGPKDLTGDLPWGDHPWIAVAPSGKDIYIGFDRVDHYVVASHDSGKTWTDPVRTNPGEEMRAGGYYFDESATVAPDGSVYFLTPVFGCCPYGQHAAYEPVKAFVASSSDGGRTWEQTKVAEVPPPPKALCTKGGCPKEWFGLLGAIASDSSGKLVVVYNGRGPDASEGEQIWTRMSTDGGASWTHPQAISPPGNVIAAFPAIAADGEGDFRVMWTDDRNGADTQTNWNIYSARSTDGGATWSEGVDVSNGAAYDYQTPEGFGFFYGDYGDIQITNDGRSAVIWAESLLYKGPGSTWLAFGK